MSEKTPLEYEIMLRGIKVVHADNLDIAKELSNDSDIEKIVAVVDNGNDVLRTKGLCRFKTLFVEYDNTNHKLYSFGKIADTLKENDIDFKFRKSESKIDLLS